MSTFNRGDTVVGLPSANAPYSYTVEGYIGRVIDIDPFEDRICLETIKFKEGKTSGYPNEEYWVWSKHFELKTAASAGVKPITIHRRVNDIPHRKPPIFNAFKKKKDWFLKQGLGSSANFIVFTDNKGKYSPYKRQPCHGNMSSRDNRGAKAVFTAVAPHMTPTRRKESKEYYRWLTKSSPYAKMFLNRTVKSVIHEGLWTRTDVPSNYLLGGLIASRYPWTQSDVLTNRSLFMENGISKNLSFILAHLFYPVNGGFVQKDYSPEEQSINPNHVNLDMIHNFITGTFQNPRLDYIDSQAYRGVFGLWSGSALEIQEGDPSIDNLFDEVSLEYSGTYEEENWDTIRTKPCSTKEDVIAFAKEIQGRI